MFRTCLLIVSVLFTVDFILANENPIAGKRLEADAKLEVGKKLVAKYEKKNYLVEVREIKRDGKLRILWVESKEESDDIDPSLLYYIGDATPTRSSNSFPLAAELSPEAQKLQARIREGEHEASRLALEVQEFKKQARRSDAEVTERRLKLSLADTFELKLQFEELQVKDLRERLIRFEGQIRERKEQREKIVESRLKQLIGSPDLQWESSTSSLEVAGTNQEFTARAGANEVSSRSTQSNVSHVEDFPTALMTCFPGVKVQIIDLINGTVMLAGEVKDEETILGINNVAKVYYAKVINRLTVNPKAEPQSNESASSTSRDVFVNQPQVVEVQRKAPDVAEDSARQIEQMREQLEPFAKKCHTALEQVHAQEDIYFRDRSNPTALRDALSALDQEAEVFRTHFAKFEPLKQRLTINQMMSGLENNKQQSRWASVQNRMNSGNATTKEASDVLKERDAASKKQEVANRELRQFQSILEDIPSEGSRKLHFNTTLPQGPNYRPDVARAWLEAQTGLKFELVSCDQLKLSFKKAFRVQQAHAGIAAGDLIVAFNEFSFDSWNQAVKAARSNDKGQIVVTCLQGGLSGSTNRRTFRVDNSRWSLQPEQSWPSGQYPGSVVKVEIELKKGDEAKPEMHYVKGTSVSPEGLIVIPLPDKSIDDNAAIAISNNDATASARCVAKDLEHHLALLKVEPPQPGNFVWMNCRLAMPTLRQKVRVGSQAGEWFVIDEPKLPKPYAKIDGFVVDTGTGTSDPGISYYPPSREGEPIIAFDGDLQGIIIESLGDGHYVGVPAVHIAKLLKDYLTNHEKLDEF